MEACSIKVNIEFADIMRSDQVLLEQFPDLEEELNMQISQIGTKSGADALREKKIKNLIANL